MNRAMNVLPHDLLWGMPTSALVDRALGDSALPEEVPQWAVDAVAAGHPVVVRRALAPRDQVAVGIRGLHREQRYAALMPRAEIRHCVRPEQLTQASGRHDWPALQALAQIRPLMAALGLDWGVSGSAGFELASGFAALHQHSDLDLIVRTPQFISRLWAADLLQALEGKACRIDVQLQTPCGGLALREWASASRQVLLKSERGALLVDQPWPLAEVSA